MNLTSKNIKNSHVSYNIKILSPNPSMNANAFYKLLGQTKMLHSLWCYFKLPKKTTRFSLIRSPFVNKRARRQYEFPSKTILLYFRYNTKNNLLLNGGIRPEHLWSNLSSISALPIGKVYVKVRKKSYFF